MFMYLGILYTSGEPIHTGGNFFEGNISIQVYLTHPLQSNSLVDFFRQDYLVVGHVWCTKTQILEGKYKSKKCSWKTSELLASQSKTTTTTTTTTTTGLYWQKQWRSFPMKSGRKSHRKWHCWLVAHSDPSEEQHMDFSVGWPVWIEGLNGLARRGWIADKASYGYGKTFPKREWWFSWRFSWYFWMQFLIHHCFVKVFSCFCRWISIAGTMTASVSSRFGEASGSKVSLILTLRTSTYGIDHL